MCFSCGDVRDHIVSHKNDHGPSYRQNLNVRVGNRIFGIDSYRDKFYRPDLVKLSRAGASFRSFSPTR